MITRRIYIQFSKRNINENYSKQLINFKWEDIYDYDDIKSRLLEIADYVKNGRCYGVILFGPPGTGKSMISKGLANKLGWSYFELKPSKILSKWYGESEFLLESFLDKVESSTPAVLHIDELDSLGMSRESEIHEVTHRLVNILLMRLQEFHDKKLKILIIGSTNIPHELDEALLRPGRFDEVIYVPLPDEKARENIWRGYIKLENIDYKELARRSERFSPADIKNIVERVFASIKNPTTQDFIKFIEEYKPSIQISTIIKFEDLARKYSRSKINIRPFGVPEITWNDLGDLEEVKSVIRESVELPIREKELAKKLGVKPVKGILLYGPPGVGKTSIAKALANELRASFIEISGEELAKVGPFRAASIIAEKFYLAIDNAPAVIYIDEIDMIAKERLGNEWRDALTELLRQMDGLREIQDVIVIGSTNRPWDLDPAILRAGRFDKIIYIPPPNIESRIKILKVLLRDLEVSDEVIKKVAEETEYFVPADLKLLVDEVKRSLLKEAIITGNLRKNVNYEDFKRILSKMKSSLTRDIIEIYEKFNYNRK